jgi:hypothetical protein
MPKNGPPVEVLSKVILEAVTNNNPNLDTWQAKF